ncbi:MFS general substrate transporter [Annulohypoxylon truncatum]|uniref:MFS general substrate transporter n=1 Tax=Annulohypoxylon truncatum TaxID=327061 RepID=UPI0020074981|nr:MFS general substrate transporter [Annulohypoxylon truncatum]KAI1204326.1 MFS general substrate transporter [Annulohypoxylon truncatum]
MGREASNEGSVSVSSANDLPDPTPIARGDLGGEQIRLQSTAASKTTQVRWRDLPNKDQLFILSLCRLSEPLSNVCLLPYIFYLVRSVLPPTSTPSDGDEVPEAAEATAARISEFSGLLIASFPLAQFLVSLPWGKLSDKHGRRLSIVAGLAVSVLANVGFGFSRSFGALLFWRILAGFANGNVGIMRTVTAEVVRERRYQTKAFLLLPLVFNAGMVASLALGGCLAEPVVNMPWLFGPGGVLNTSRNPDGVAWALEFPYALPALLNAVVLGASLILAVAGLKETLPGKEGQSDVGLKAGAAITRWVEHILRRRQQYIRIDSGEDTFLGQVRPDFEKPRPEATSVGRQELPFRNIWTRKVLCALVSFGLLPLHNSAFMHIFPVYLSSPPADNGEASFFAFAGGLGLRSSTIGMWLSTFGICGILLQLLIYPRLQTRIGTRGVFRIALVLFPITYAAAPYLSLLAGEDDGALRWVFLGLVVCSQIMARTMAIPSTVILLTEAAPSKTVLGTVHGAGNMLASLARTVGPAVGGYVFALGVQEGIIGLVWWLYLVAIALCALGWSYLMEGDEY